MGGKGKRGARGTKAPSDTSMKDASPKPSSGKSAAPSSRQSVDPDAPIQSIEAPDQSQLYARLSKLPFYNNFAEAHRGVRFPNPVDVRNRVDFARGESADPSRDPFETRVLMNGLKISRVWGNAKKERPPYYDPDGMTVLEIQDILLNHFPGINLYPELRSPAGSSNLWGRHWGYLLLTLYDCEGLLAARERFKTDHVMALLQWQLLDFTDIVLLHGWAANHDEPATGNFRWRQLSVTHRFIVIPFHCPDHWAVVIYDRDTCRLGVVDTHPDRRARERNFLDMARVANSYLDVGLTSEEQRGRTRKLFKVPVTPQNSSTNCGWQVANYVAFFFRENRGRNNWEFADWTDSNLVQDIPPNMEKEDAMVLIWMFAIRSEMNGTGFQVRFPDNCPYLTFDKMREVKKQHGLISQQEIAKRKLVQVQGTPERRIRLPTSELVGSLQDRFSKVDLIRPIDHRTSRLQSAGPSLITSLDRLSMSDGPDRARSVSVALHSPIGGIGPLDGNWSIAGSPVDVQGGKTKPKRESRASTGSQPGSSIFSSRGSSAFVQNQEQAREEARKREAREAKIRNQKRICQRWVDCDYADEWVPFPAILSEHTTWAERVMNIRKEEEATPQEQVTARSERASRRLNARGKGEGS